MKYICNFCLFIYMFFCDFCENNFSKKLIGFIEKKNNKIITSHIYNYLPINFILLFYNKREYDYFYKINNKYYYSYGDLKISPILKSIYITKNNNSEKKNIFYIYEKYQNTFPFWLVLKLESLEKYEFIEITKKNILISIPNMENNENTKIINISNYSNNSILFDIYN